MAQLLRLHAAITLRSNYSAYTHAERLAAAEPMAARNLEIQPLWMDGVSQRVCVLAAPRSFRICSGAALIG